MLIDCTTKGCLQKTEAKLDPETNMVMCDACGNVIENVTPYTKKALKDVGQILRHKAKAPFQSLCQQCNGNQPLYTDGERAFCRACNSQVHITPAFMRGLKEYEKTRGQE
jgi:hypothetical protein